MFCFEGVDSVCRQREAEVQEWMESASQSDRGFEEAQAKSNLVSFIPQHKHHHQRNGTRVELYCCAAQCAVHDQAPPCVKAYQLHHIACPLQVTLPYVTAVLHTTQITSLLVGVSMSYMLLQG